MKQDSGDAQEDPDRRGLDMHHIMDHENELNRIYREQNNKDATKSDLLFSGNGLTHISQSSQK